MSIFFIIFTLYLKINNMNNKEKVNTLLVAITVMVFAAVILAWPTQLLWNGCLVPAINGINEIGFWQALGLNILTSIMLKSNATNAKK